MIADFCQQVAPLVPRPVAEGAPYGLGFVVLPIGREVSTDENKWHKLSCYKKPDRT